MPRPKEKEHDALSRSSSVGLTCPLPLSRAFRPCSQKKDAHCISQPNERAARSSVDNGDDQAVRDSERKKSRPAERAECIKTKRRRGGEKGGVGARDRWQTEETWLADWLAGCNYSSHNEAGGATMHKGPRSEERMWPKSAKTSKSTFFSSEPCCRAMGATGDTRGRLAS